MCSLLVVLLIVHQLQMVMKLVAFHYNKLVLVVCPHCQLPAVAACEKNSNHSCMVHLA